MIIWVFLVGRKTRCSSLQNFNSEELKSVQRRRGEQAAGQQNDKSAQSSNKPIYPALHLHFFILSDKPWFLPLAFLAMNQIADWHVAWCFGGNGNYQCVSAAAVKGAVQTHLKKHSLKNFNLLDLTWFVLKRLESTPFIFIKFWKSLNQGIFIVYRHPE